jgi:nickel superoxide dismutase
MNLFKLETVYAHCDIPCGIYDPKPSQIAAATVLKMVQKINELVETDAYKNMDVNAMANFSRMVMVKEEHGRKCKDELLVLWTDFFKPEDLTMYPKLHETIWTTTKLISKNKQEVNLEAAEQLVKSVNEIAEMFEKVNASRKK